MQWGLSHKETQSVIWEYVIKLIKSYKLTQLSQLNSMFYDKLIKMN